jgi:hypothetical protein
MKPIWGRTRGGEWYQVESYTDRDKPLVIGRAIGEPGYCIYHVKSGGSVVTRPKLNELRPMLPKLLKLKGVDWALPFDTLSQRVNLTAKVRDIIGGSEGLHVSERALHVCHDDCPVICQDRRPNTKSEMAAAS